MMFRSWWIWCWYGSEEATYVRDIQILKADKPLDLPAVKPLKARIVKRKAKAGRSAVIPMRRQG